MEMAGQRQPKLSHRGEGQSETNEMGRAKCVLKHQQDVKQEGFKAGVLSSGSSNPDWHCVNYSN